MTISGMVRVLAAALTATALLTWGAGALAEEQLTPEQKAEITRLRGILESLHPQKGDVAIPSAKAVLHLGTGYYFLNKQDAQKVLVDAWRNPPGATTDVLGVVFPVGKTFADSWGAVVTYENTLYVSDKDAKTADYDKVLTDVREHEDEINRNRSEGGFSTVHLIGWAQPPTYDPARHSMIWARDLKFSGTDVDTLNYDVRLLGRSGVLSLNMVSTMPDLEQVRTDAAGLAAAASFNPGSRYEDHAKGDKEAGYGLAGLVAAGVGVAVAKKLGFLAIALLFLKKGFVVVLAALAAAGRWFKGVFGGRKPRPASARSSWTNFDDPPPGGEL